MSKWAYALVLGALLKASVASACAPTDSCCLALPAGADVADIFHDKMGRTGPQLPAFGKLINYTMTTACLGVTTDPTTLGVYSCNGDGNPDPRHYSDALDHLWVQRSRTCQDGTMPADQVGGCFYPPNGLIYDLGGAANKVVLFPMIDHGPLPQEAFEYAVYLSDNPNATGTVLRGSPTDPMQWNEATLLKFYEKGWNPNDANPNPNTDVSDDDTTVWGLPCGINFRYVSLVGGNNGNPSAACTFYSNEDEIDAVAGLTEDETGICPDLDMDGHTAKSCGGDDCDDGDKMTHPGAPEPCDATKDLNCDGTIGGCPASQVCADHVCQTPCLGGEFPCGGGEACSNGFCVTAPCGSGPPCAPGLICNNGTCVDPCTGAMCPAGLTCLDGKCVDPCANIQCPMNQYCSLGMCVPSCACAGCTMGVCDTMNGMCVDPGCGDAMCPAGTLCLGGACVDACNTIICPIGQQCTTGVCVVNLCFGRDCGAGRACDPSSGMCYSTVDGGDDASVDTDGGTDDAAIDVDGDAIKPARDFGPGSSVDGCACELGGRARPLPWSALVLLGLIVLFTRARRKA